MTNESVLIISLFTIAVVFLGIMVYFSQQQLIKERQKRDAELKHLESEVGSYVEKLKQLHQQELEQLKTLYGNPLPASRVDAIGSNTAKILEDAKLEALKISKENADMQRLAKSELEEARETAHQIIAEAELTAKSIIKEAQEKSRLHLQREEEQLQKSIVKVVIQVVKKVLNKSLSYDEHKQLILDSLKEIK